MPVWWRYGDIVDAVGEEQANALEADLLKGLRSGAIGASAEFVIYSTLKEMIREELVALSPSVFREKQVIFNGKKKGKFQPKIGKYFNPACALPDDYGRSPFEVWAVDCFGLSYRGSDLIRELELPVVEHTKAIASQPAPKRGGGRPPSKSDWSNFAAALAVVAAIDDEGVDPMASAASIYERVALVLQGRLGKDANFFELDNVQDAITLAQDWIRKGQAEARRQN